MYSTTSPIDRLLPLLKSVRAAGENKWLACCPAHEDHNPSLSVAVGDDGRVLLHCFTGCKPEEITSAVGLMPKDLFPESSRSYSHHHHTSAIRLPKAKRKVMAYSTMAEAINACNHLGIYSKTWLYEDHNGKTVGAVARWNTSSGGKEIRPFVRTEQGWQSGAMPEPRPLYGLPELQAAADQPVIVVEGEKCVDAARTIGFVATTSVGGSQAAGKTDWQPLSEREVWILPDHDEPGRQYADTVRGRLWELGCQCVRTIELPNLEPGGDVYDWINAHGDAAEPDCIRDNLRAIAGKVKPDAPPPEPKPRSKSSATTNPSARIEPEILTMSNVAPQVVRWLWPQRIALGRISVIVGRPGEGKSFVTVDMAARLSTGRPMPGTDADTGLTGDTLLLCAEDDPADTIRPRLIAADADCGRVHLLRGASLTDDDEGGKKSIAIDLSNVDIIRDTLDRFSECKLVVVDPVGSYLGGRVDAHRDNEVRAVLGPLSALAAERGVAVVLVAHTRKSQSDFADDAVLGSRAFTGIARNVHHLLTDPEDRDRRLFLPGKCNLGKRPPGLAMRVTDEPARVEWEPEPLTDIHADDMMTVQQSRGPKPESLNSAVEWLRDQLRHGPVPSDELKGRGKDAGHSWATLRRAKECIGILPRKQHFSGVWVWTLPVTVAQDALEDAQNP